SRRADYLIVQTVATAGDITEVRGPRIDGRLRQQRRVKPLRVKRQRQQDGAEEERDRARLHLRPARKAVTFRMSSSVHLRNRSTWAWSGSISTTLGRSFVRSQVRICLVSGS